MSSGEGLGAYSHNSWTIPVKKSSFVASIRTIHQMHSIIYNELASETLHREHTLASSPLTLIRYLKRHLGQIGLLRLTSSHLRFHQVNAMVVAYGNHHR